jgi:DMSO/TMAO reductase YedYZ molybdopterin-dependent catalytic subunit
MPRKLLNLPYSVFFICGLAAGTAALALSLFLRISINGLFVPELASQALVSITSGEIESRAVETLGPLAKYSTFFGATVVNLIVYGLIGLVVGSLLAKIRSKQYVLRAVFSSFVSYVLILIITLILVAVSAVPDQSLSIPIVSLATLILPSFAYGFIFPFFFEKIRKGKSLSSGVETQFQNLDGNTPPSKTTKANYVDYQKRALIRAIIVSAIALPLVYLGFNRLLSKSGQPQQQMSSSSASSASQIPQLMSKSIPAGFEGPKLTPLLDAEVTPAYLFYRIDKNAIVPQVDAKEWSLAVKGLVNNPLVMGYDEIKRLRSVEQFATLSCISNKIGGDLISTALWKGVRLGDLLSMAKVKPSVKYIVFRCSDGYDVGIPLESGLMDGTILAYDMNNAPLTAEHGYPVRAIVPGFYGMMNPKWITEIELVDKTYEGFWQRKGWSNKKNDNIYSSIVIPGDQPIRNRFPHLVNENFMPGKASPIAGFAFAGDRGISKIEVSTDGGKTWKTAIIKEPLSNYTWVLWTGGFIPKENGDYRIVVRATDKTGKVQASDVATPFPNGASGFNMVGVKT